MKEVRSRFYTSRRSAGRASLQRETSPRRPTDSQADRRKQVSDTQRTQKNELSVSFLREAPKREEFLVFGAPLIEEDEIAEVVATLRSGWLGTGPKTKLF